MKKGERYLITSGEYSDYGITDHFEALKDFSFDIELERWLDEHGRLAYAFEAFAFLDSLRERGLVESVKVQVVHLCDFVDANENCAKDRSDA